MKWKSITLLLVILILLFLIIVLLLPHPNLPVNYSSPTYNSVSEPGTGGGPPGGRNNVP